MTEVGDRLPICRIIIVKVVFTSKLVIELSDGDELSQVRVESDLRVTRINIRIIVINKAMTHLITSDRIHKRGDTAEEGIDPPSVKLESAPIGLRERGIRTAYSRPDPVPDLREHDEFSCRR